MKKILLVLLAASMITVGCSNQKEKMQTKQELAETAVKDWLTATLGDPAKYEPTSFTPVALEPIGNNKEYLLPTFENTDSVLTIMHLYRRANKYGAVDKTSQIFLISKDGKKVVGEMGEL